MFGISHTLAALSQAIPNRAALMLWASDQKARIIKIALGKRAFTNHHAHILRAWMRGERL